MSGLDKTKLLKRTASALIMAPLTLFVIWYGEYPFLIFMILAWAWAFYEWLQLSLKSPMRLMLIAVGVLYTLSTFVSFYLLRDMYALSVIFLFLFMIWMSDIGAYFAGKMIGGPKMAEGISPNKTWAGMFGAVCGPALVGVAYMLMGIEPSQNLVFLIVLGVAVGVFGQAGDLMISALKRHVGAKDTGHLIPGHGGLLDRIDAMMLSAPVFFIMMIYLANMFHG